MTGQAPEGLQTWWPSAGAQRLSPFIVLWRCPPGEACTSLSPQSRFGSWCSASRSGESPFSALFARRASRLRANHP